MDKKTFMLTPQSRAYIKEYIDKTIDGYYIVIQEPSRTLEQNSFQWPYLEGFAKNMKWTVNNEQVWMIKDEWKHVLTSAFEGDVKPRLAAAYESEGVVMLGKRTSKYGKKKFAEWMEWLIAAATLKGIEPVFKNGDKNWKK